MADMNIPQKITSREVYLLVVNLSREVREGFDSLSKNGCEYGRSVHVQPIKKEDQENLTFKWINEKLIAPIVTGITVGGIMLIIGFVFVQLQK
jgi:hypothetical protein